MRGRYNGAFDLNTLRHEVGEVGEVGVVDELSRTKNTEEVVDSGRGHVLFVASAAGSNSP
jgi:hypothetical protein